MKERRTRFLLVDVVVLDVFQRDNWKENYGGKWLVERQKVLSTHVMLIEVLHLLPVMNLEKAIRTVFRNISSFL